MANVQTHDMLFRPSHLWQMYRHLLSCLGHLIYGKCTDTVDDVARDNERVENAI